MKSLVVLLLLAACAIPTDRSSFAQAWYYERLTPYYENNLALTPRTHLRAVSELIGQDIRQPDGSRVHVDTLRFDLAKTAIRITCPDTSLLRLPSRIVHDTPTYMIFHHLRCTGFATH